VIVGHVLVPQQDVWKHLAENVLGSLVANTALLIACIVPLTALMGVGLGWLTGACEYPGRKFFGWALVLPFAIPPYVFAFVYLGLFDFSGPVQTALRTAFPSMGFIDIRNSFGVATILSLAFYPYVYLMARSAFMTQGRTAMEAARTLGMNPSLVAPEERNIGMVFQDYALFPHLSGKTMWPLVWMASLKLKKTSELSTSLPLLVLKENRASSPMNSPVASNKELPWQEH